MGRFHLVFAPVFVFAACLGAPENAVRSQAERTAGTPAKAGIVALLAFDPARLAATATFLEKKDYKGGVAYFNGLDKAGQRDPRLRLLYARLLIGGGDYRQGAAVLRELAAVYPTLAARAIYQTGVQLDRAGERTVAMGYFQEAIETDPFYAEPYLALSLASPDKKEARRACEQALALAEPSTALHIQCEKRLKELGGLTNPGK